jgi:F-type H+-transporting ATPase subunit b
VSVLAIRTAVLAQEASSDKENLYPHAAELLVGALAFAIVFYFLWKWVIPRVNQLLEERRQQIQGEIERAEATRGEADHLLADYREQLAGARDEANRIIEEGRRTADQLRRDLQTKAEEEASATVARAQDEIRAERDRVFEDLRAQIGDIAVELAARVVNQSLDKQAHEKLIDDYIEQVATGDKGQG